MFRDEFPTAEAYLKYVKDCEESLYDSKYRHTPDVFESVSISPPDENGLAIKFYRGWTTKPYSRPMFQVVPTLGHSTQESEEEHINSCTYCMNNGVRLTKDFWESLSRFRRQNAMDAEFYLESDVGMARPVYFNRFMASKYPHP